MRTSIKVLSVAGALGVILSFCAAVYTAARYIALAHAEKAIEALAVDDDVMAPKIEIMLNGHVARNLIMGELKAQHEQNASLRSALAKMVVEAKQHAVNETFLWIVVGFVFLVLLIHSENSRQREASVARME